VTKSGMTRAPIFRVADVAEAEALVSWVRDNEGFFERRPSRRRATASCST